MATLGIHLFRKDLRVSDNYALNELAKHVDKVVGVFIFDPHQINQTTSKSNHYSKRAAQFVIDSVLDLDDQIGGNLIIAYDDPAIAIEQIIATIRPAYLSFNSDFTPYSIKRDTDILRVCAMHNIRPIVNENDQTLVPMRSVIKQDGSPYMIYGSFFKKLSSHSIDKPLTPRISWTKPYVRRVRSDPIRWSLVKQNTLVGGRREALVKLNAARKIESSELLSHKTAMLSAYLNMGCVSIREVYRAHKESLRSLAWRDFFLCIYRFSATGNDYNKHIDDRYDRVRWPSIKESEWIKFMNCNTGFLLVDSTMAELLQSGSINNRARLILSTFWIKYLMICPFDKSYGSQIWFSKLLIDCSASQNKLNHQWVIGDLDLSGRRFKMANTHPLTGRMIRVDNEMIKRYDPKFKYIKKWIPAFKDLTLKECKSQVKDTTPMYEWRTRYMKYAKLFEKLPR
jgi:deoxyribodipyrimidine photo-lyase